MNQVPFNSSLSDEISLDEKELFSFVKQAKIVDSSNAVLHISPKHWNDLNKNQITAENICNIIGNISFVLNEQNTHLIVTH